MKQLQVIQYTFRAGKEVSKTNTQDPAIPNIQAPHSDR